MKYDPFAFEMPWRPNYEFKIATVWLSVSVVYLLLALIDAMPMGVMWWCAAGCLCMGLYWFRPGIDLWCQQRRLAGYPLEFKTLTEFRKKLNSIDHKNDLWLGRGFEWSVKECQYLHQLNERDVCDLNEIVTRDRRWRLLLKSICDGSIFIHPIRTLRKVFLLGTRIADELGYPWIHGIGHEDKEQWMDLSHTNGHTLIFGTTGSGKTRLFDLIINQAIARGEPVFIIDPKGDADMEQNAREACKALGREDAFVFFHLGKPDQSVRLNPLANWHNVTEIASRIAALLPQDAGSSPFTSFSWQAVNTVVQGLVLCNEQPTLVNLCKYLDGGLPMLVSRTLASWFKLKMGENVASATISRLLGSETMGSAKATSALIGFYKLKMAHNQSPVVDSLISMYEHDAAHFSKMIASLLPLLNKLTSDELQTLLSPPSGDVFLNYRDMKGLIENRCVVYIGLDTLSNAEVGAAVGSLILADLTAVSGNIYKFGQSWQDDESGFEKDTPKHINVFVDEANEVANNPFIQLLNKGRGAGFRIFAATQTYSDFVTRLGSKDKANQVLGNMNNLIALRSLDPATQEYITGRMSKTKIREIQRDQGQSTMAYEPILSNDTFRESLKNVEVDLVPPSYLGKLPNLEYFAVVAGGKVIKGRLPILIRQ